MPNENDETHVVYSMSSKIVELNWIMKQEIHTTQKSSFISVISLAHHRHPMIAFCMLLPALASAALIIAKFIFDYEPFSLLASIWFLVGFGGMYLVVLSAARELKDAEKQRF